MGASLRPASAVQLVVAHRQHPAWTHPPPVIAYIIARNTARPCQQIGWTNDPYALDDKAFSQVPAYRKLLEKGPTLSLVLTPTMIESNLIPFLGLHIHPLHRQFRVPPRRRQLQRQQYARRAPVATAQLPMMGGRPG